MTTWEAMESAPNDRRILVYIPGCGIFAGIWDDDMYAKKPRPYWGIETGGCPRIYWMRQNQPTHWMELPKHPEAEPVKP